MQKRGVQQDGAESKGTRQSEGVAASDLPAGPQRALKSVGGVGSPTLVQAVLATEEWLRVGSSSTATVNTEIWLWLLHS